MWFLYVFPKYFCLLTDTYFFSNFNIFTVSYLFWKLQVFQLWYHSLYRAFFIPVNCGLEIKIQILKRDIQFITILPFLWGGLHCLKRCFIFQKHKEKAWKHNVKQTCFEDHGASTLSVLQSCSETLMLVWKGKENR